MADKKISELTALTGANVDSTADYIPIVDTSATETKKILVNELSQATGLTFQSPTIVTPTIANRSQFTVIATITGANAVGTVDLAVAIPDNAIITSVVQDNDALTGTTDDTGTITLKLGTGGTAITADVAMPAAGVTSVAASSTNIPTKLTGAKDLKAVIATRNMASGTVKYFISYVIGV